MTIQAIEESPAAKSTAYSNLARSKSPSASVAPYECGFSLQVSQCNRSNHGAAGFGRYRELRHIDDLT